MTSRIGLISGIDLDVCRMGLKPESRFIEP